MPLQPLRTCFHSILELDTADACRAYVDSPANSRVGLIVPRPPALSVSKEPDANNFALWEAPIVVQGANVSKFGETSFQVEDHANAVENSERWKYRWNSGGHWKCARGTSWETRVEAVVGTSDRIGHKAWRSNLMTPWQREMCISAATLAHMPDSAHIY